MQRRTSFSFKRSGRVLAAGLALLAAGASQAAEEKFVYLTNWFAQAEHGGFYQAVATGLYKKHGLDVTIKMGGPQVNGVQLLAAGQADCIMGSSQLQMTQARSNGVPIVTVAALFQKDPQALIGHEDVKSFEDMKGKTILIASTAQQGYWPWLKTKYGFTDAQTRPYTFSIQPFLADKNTVQQGYITSETCPAEGRRQGQCLPDGRCGLPVRHHRVLHGQHGGQAQQGGAGLRAGQHRGLEELPGRPGPGQCPDQEGQPADDRRPAGLQRGQAQGVRPGDRR
jgi:NitT/TauT family transport system substrate-binding protein